MEPYPSHAAAHNDRDHRVIAQAILGRDGAIAESLMRTHMDHIYDYATRSGPVLDEVIDWHLPRTNLDLTPCALSGGRVIPAEISG